MSERRPKRVAWREISTKGIATLKLKNIVILHCVSLIEDLLMLCGSNFTWNSITTATNVIFPFKRSCDVYCVKYKNSLVTMKV